MNMKGGIDAVVIFMLRIPLILVLEGDKKLLKNLFLFDTFVSEQLGEVGDLYYT